MNHISINTYEAYPDVTELELILTPQTEEVFRKTVFPFLYDGYTSGCCSAQPDGRIRYVLLVDSARSNQLKGVLINAILTENGQMN